MGRGTDRAVSVGRLRRAGFDIGDRILDGLDLLGGIVGNLAAELFFERHDQLDGVERVGAEIVDEAGALGDLRLVDAEMLDDDLLNACGYIAHWPPPSWLFESVLNWPPRRCGGNPRFPLPRQRANGKTSATDGP